MKEPVELEPMKKIDEIRSFSNKEMKHTKESREHCRTPVNTVNRSGRGHKVTYPDS